MSRNALASDAETGMAMSEGDWLRIHYEACAAGYAEQLAFCQFERGSRIIDVGCGPGLFLPIPRQAARPGQRDRRLRSLPIPPRSRSPALRSLTS